MEFVKSEVGMNFSERLNLAMKEAGMTQGGLAKAVGMAQSSINKLLNGANGSRKSVEIAKVLRVRPEWLATGDGAMRAGDGTHHPDSTIPNQAQWFKVDSWDKDTPLEDGEVEVPFLKDIEFACGDGSYSEEDYNGYMLRFSKATLRRVGASSDGSGILCFPARGDSMEPNIPNGTTVAVNTNDKKIVDGKIYAISENGWKRLKMLYRVSHDTIGIRSYNKTDHPDEERPLSEVEIIGRVFWWSVLDY